MIDLLKQILEKIDFSNILQNGTIIFGVLIAVIISIFCRTIVEIVKIKNNNS